MNTARLLLALICLTVPGAASAQDAEAGEKVFKKCASCHKLGDAAKNGIGPVLNDVIGRPAATFEGYKYSKTLLAAGEKGLVWDVGNISEYITDPRAFMRSYLDDRKAKPKMTFKLKDEEDRRDVIAYLATFSEAPQAADMPQTDAALELPEAAANAVCVVNGSDETHFFVVENADGTRSTATLQATSSLCSAPAETTDTGTVSVFESEDAFEGCSRRIPAGTVEIMLRYSDFDRCLWSSNQS